MTIREIAPEPPNDCPKIQENYNPDGVILVEKSGVQILKPRAKPDLAKHFDTSEVDIDSKDFVDYSKFKKAVLESQR